MKRSITLSGHRTSVSLENAFWRALQEIAVEGETTPTDIISRIDDARHPEDNLSSAIRVHILNHYREKSGLNEHL
ncbi:MAG: ribbon-helix-helix domain-containing protein [Pseudomonadota bacterium]